MKITTSSRLADHITKDILLTEASPPHWVSGLILLVLMALMGFFSWAAFSQLTITSVGQGVVLPAAPVQEVQHPEGGRIISVHVTEGQKVRVGDVLMTLDDLEQQADFQVARTRYGSLLARVETLRAFISGQDINKVAIPVEFLEFITIQEQTLQSMRSEVAHIESQIQLMTEISDIRSELAEQKLGTKTQSLESKSSAIYLKNELLRIKRSAQRDLQQARVDLNDASQTLKKFKAKYERVQILAGVDGEIQDIKYKTSEAVVPPGGVLMTVIPSGPPTRVEVKIPTSDIGFIREGQEVKIKFQTYDYVRYGTLSGKVKTIYPGHFADSKGTVFHKITVEINAPHLKNQLDKSVKAGMQVQADIITDHQTVLRYLFRPIYVAFDQALRER